MTRIPAVYRDGVFVPEIPVPLLNETRAEILIEETVPLPGVPLDSEMKAQLV